MPSPLSHRHIIIEHIDKFADFLTNLPQCEPLHTRPSETGFSIFQVGIGFSVSDNRSNCDCALFGRKAVAATDILSGALSDPERRAQLRKAR